MHNQIQPQAPHSLKEALDQTGRLWWVEQRLNALGESEVTDEAFLKGLKHGILEQVQKWAEKDKALVYFGNRAAVENLVTQHIEEKFGAPVVGTAIVADSDEDLTIVEKTWPDGTKSGRVVGTGKGNATELDQ